jgi:hypothetical protein
MFLSASFLQYRRWIKSTKKRKSKIKVKLPQYLTKYHAMKTYLLLN